MPDVGTSSLQATSSSNTGCEKSVNIIISTATIIIGDHNVSYQQQ